MKQLYLATLVAFLALFYGLDARGQNITQANFTGILVPQYMASGGSTRLPVMFRATVSGLTANTTYRYYTTGATNSSANGASVDFGTTNSAGLPMLTDGSTFLNPSSGSMTTAGSYQTFTTDATGNYTGWFGFVNTGNGRFTAGNTVYPVITIGNTGGTILNRYALDLGITTMTFSSNATDVTGIYSNSFSPDKSMVALWDNTAGTGRPLALTYVENEGLTVSSTVVFYTNNVNGNSGYWGTQIPNSNANGVRRIEFFSNPSGSSIYALTDADGTWGGVSTANPNGGTTPIVLDRSNVERIVVSQNLTLSNTMNVTGNVTFGNVNNVTLTTGGNLNLKSSSSGTAVIADITNNSVNSGNAISGNITVERYLPQGKRAYRQLASGVTTTANILTNWQNNGSNTAGNGIFITGSTSGANGFDASTTGLPNMFSYTPGSPSFTAITNTNTNTLNSLRGYRVFVYGDRNANLTLPNLSAGTGSPNIAMNSATTIRATGMLNTGTVTFTNTGTTTTAGTDNTVTLGSNVNDFALIANPYWNSVNWDNLTKSNLSTTYWIWDPTLGNRGGYVSYTTSTGNNNGSSAMSQHIQPGQAIFVQTTGANPSLTFNESNKSGTFTNTFRMANQTPSKVYVSLYENTALANNGSNQDCALGAFRDDFSNSVAEGAMKFSNPDENIAIVRNNSNWSTDARHTVTGTDTLPVRIWNLYSNNSYTLKLDAMDFDAGINASLIDKKNNQSYPVNLSGSTTLPFSFSNNDSSTFYNRFLLVFNNSTPLEGKELSLKANARKGEVSLDWTMKPEKEMKEYQVERSADGRNFDKLATVKADFNNNQTATYHYADVAPLRGKNYYRILGIGINGSTLYSTVATITTSSDANFEASVYPNPIRNGNFTLTLTNAQAGNCEVLLINALGQTVYRTQVQVPVGNSTHTMQLDDKLASGIYLLTIQGSADNKQTMSVRIQ
ncbi:MAG: T9SS type A sorting domain-containing protein [Bacteroidetes bacterium]|nr:T9SS type A sorting domain-containing protein [Bacteroidota bacterium]